MFRFLHAADIHLDSPLVGLNRYEDAPTEILRQASRHAFDRLVETAIEKEVAFVILAGDLFDGEWKDYNTGKFFVDRMQKLRVHDIRVYSLRGNHDAESRLTKNLNTPDNVFKFKTGKGSSFGWPELKVTLHGCSYLEAATTTNLVPKYGKAVEDHFNIGVLHTALGSENSGHANYAPCNLEDLKGKRYDYWALGHIHTRKVVSEDPWIIFPGNLQGRHARETGPKGATLVTVKDNKVNAVEALELDVLRWEVLNLDLRGIDSEEAMLDLVRCQLAALVEGAEDRPVAARLVFGGKTILHSDLLLEAERLELDLRSLASEVGDGTLWLEKIQIQTELPRDAKGEGSLAELAKIIKGRVVSEESLKRRASELATLAKRLDKSGVRSEIDPTDFDHLRESYDEAKDFLEVLLTRESVGGDDLSEAAEE